MTDKYILNANGDPEPCNDLLEWAKWYETANRRVAEDHFGDVRVSTVFLGIDHSFGSGGPMLFETMIFGGEHDQYQERSMLRDQALEMHKRACSIINGGTGQ